MERLYRNPMIDAAGPREEPVAEVRHDAEPEHDQQELTELHPGTPGHHKVMLDGLIFVGQTAAVMTVKRAGGGMATLPKAHAFTPYMIGLRPGTRIKVMLPVWLYRKVRPQLLNTKASV